MVFTYRVLSQGVKKWSELAKRGGKASEMLCNKPIFNILYGAITLQLICGSHPIYESSYPCLPSTTCCLATHLFYYHHAWLFPLKERHRDVRAGRVESWFNIMVQNRFVFWRKDQSDIYAFVCNKIKRFSYKLMMPRNMFHPKITLVINDLPCQYL